MYVNELQLIGINLLQVRDEKAQLNRRVDKLGERLHNHNSQLEELASRLKEFEEGRQAAERRLEAAKHQIEVQEALGPQVVKRTVLCPQRCKQSSDATKMARGL